MEFFNYYEVGETVLVDLESGPEKQSYHCVIKKMKEGLVALAFPVPSDPPLSLESLPNDSILLINKKSGEPPLSFSSRIVSNRAFPVIIIKPDKPLTPLPETENRAVSDEERVKQEINKELYDNEKVAERNSARVEDHFPIKIELMSREEAGPLKKDYLLKPTRLRETGGRTDLNIKTVNNPEHLASISHLDPALIDVIKDIYFRLHMLSSALLTHKNDDGQKKEEGEDICVDISGTGLKLVTSKHLSTGDIIKMIISPPQAVPQFSVTVMGEVRRTKKIQSVKGKGGEYAVGINYFAIHEDDMEEITHYTFQLQQEFLRLRRAENRL